MIHIAFGILAFHRHFAHVAHVEHTAVLAHGLMLIDDARILNGHVESSEGTDECPEGNVFVVQTGSFVFHFVVLDFLVDYFF